MNVGEWNFKTREYEPYELPPKAKLYSEDMSEIIACAKCGKNLEFGQGFTSRKIHTPIGFGFPVCSDCYELEFKEEKESRSEQ